MADDIEIRLQCGQPSGFLEASLTLEQRAVHVVKGPSGSGKTTLLRAIAGLDAGARGLVRVGAEVWLDTARRVCVPLHRRRLGFVFQDGRLFDHLNVAANLRYGWRRTPKRRRRVAFDEVVERLALHGLLERRPRHLSAGQRQRVAFARSLLASPRLLLMDEAFSALEEAALPALLEVVSDLPRRGMTVLYVTHSSVESGALSGRTVSITAGRALAGAHPDSPTDACAAVNPC